MSECSLPAGAELDTLLAKKLFEWKIDPSRCKRCGWLLQNSNSESGCTADQCNYVGAVERRYDEPAPWSTDESRVGDILDAMLVKGFSVQIRAPIASAQSYRVTFERWSLEATDLAQAEGDTLAYAVTLAAVRAFGDSISSIRECE